jgi:regulator of protease activity HflC (stomatin/prohibitin superfamily)
VQHARAFAGRVLARAGRDADTIVAAAFAMALGRNPTAEEAKALREFLARQTELFKERPDSKTLLGPLPPDDGDPAFAAAVVDLCHAVLNLNEFLYID